MSTQKNNKFRNPLFVYMVGGVCWAIGTQIEHEFISMLFRTAGISCVVTAFILYFNEKK